MFEDFPLLKKCIYLNTAYVGLMSKGLYDFRRKYDLDYINKGDHVYMSKHQIVNKARISISKFFGSKINQTFVSSNFSSALRSVLEYVPKKSNFLVLEEDYPSILNAVKERSFNYHKIPITVDLELNILKLIEEKKIDVIAISLVQWISGFLIDIEFLKKIKLKFPEIIIIGDGTQFLGGHFFNFQDSPFDFIAASGYKWLISGFGNGLFMISDNFFDYTKINDSILLDKIFDGHSDLLAIESLNYSINTLQKKDFKFLINKKNETTSILKKSLKELNLLDDFSLFRENHSSIFNIKLNQKQFKFLIKNNVRCVKRGSGVRVSVHFYNSKEDIKSFISILKLLN